MKSKYIAAAVCAGVLILTISIWVGFLSVRNDNDLPAPVQTAEPAVTPAALQTEAVIVEETPVYTIILSGSTLTMLSDEKKIKEALIAPDVFPSADIEALSAGITYSSYEEALMDWESLSG
ncbi:MAG: hypothetical protein J6N52_01180 [Clostridia bacterium]|nr:hypothetical protein [Clostridia bacterium]